MTRADLRSRTGMVLQDTWLFSGTIRENIAYGRPGASDEDIVAAATAAYVDRFVHALPDGYDTVLDDEASNLSVGERQLVTIARAFLSDPRILILDEATSSVDTRTELLIQRAMSRLREDRTSFVIAHRLSTIRDADLILVMEHGDIVEQGTHEELIAREGAYWRLYVSQFEQAANDALAANARARLPLLQAAVASCNGPLLAGLLPTIEAAVAPTRLHIEQLYLGCARALVGEYMQLGHVDHAIVALQNILRIVPSDEESHRQLIEIYATLGRYHEAEQQLLLCRTVLARDLGLKPSAATIDSIRLARERRLAGQQPVQACDGPLL